jgi:general secretion pathway protein D
MQRTETRQHTLEPDELRTANGVVLEEKDPQELTRLAEALDALTLDLPAAPLLPAENPALDANAIVPVKLSAAEAVAMARDTALPPQATRLLTLPKLSDIEIGDLQERLTLQLGADSGYTTAEPMIGDSLPQPPQGIRGVTTLTHRSDAGASVLRFGFKRYESQPPQLWALGVLVDASGHLTVNPDLDALEPMLKDMVTSMQELRKGLTFTDLEAKLIQLSYVDDKIALSMLKGMGLTTLPKPEDIPAQADFAKLPYVVAIPDPEKGDTGLVGSGTKTEQTKWGLSLTPGVASDITNNAVASPLSQLMVVFHPAHPEQYSRVRYALDTYIDRPARQIFIEAMVLEIGEEGLKDLGVNWEMAGSPVSINALGSLSADGLNDTFDLRVSDLANIIDPFEGTWSLRIRALVREGKAEILSRPSVLTLNNRQSTIRVGKDLPIASSYEGLYSSSNKVAFNFQYLPTGILLNIRPRINEQGTEVSMLIDTMVSAPIPDQELELKANDGTVLATAPTISTRRVQTYGRIRNNTPFIIGGLVARETVKVWDKVPLLGDLPLIKYLFRSETTDTVKREVIIVLTPFILPERKLIPRSLPKDEDLFDSFGHELFRDSYRIRNEDVFDLTFLLENPRIVDYRTKARQVADKNFRIGENEPFRSFIRDQVPGESILVARMVYEVIKRLELESKVDPARIIYLTDQQVGGYEVDFLEDLLDKTADGKFTNLGDRTLAITFLADRTDGTLDNLDDGPLPEVRMLSCPDRQTWAKLLWELNQPAANGQKRHTILIQNQGDLLRLRRALALKKIAVLNGGTDQMRLRNFSVGKVLLMPELKADQIHLIDIDSAMFFFHTEQYYAATLHEIETQLKDMEQQLSNPEIQLLLQAESADN